MTDTDQTSEPRKFNGKEYWNCDKLTDEEMSLIDDWENATDEQRSVFLDKHYPNPITPGLFTRDPFDVYVYVRLADVDRTVEWRTVKASSLKAAIKVAEAMLDVEVCLEASVIPGGVVT